MLPDKQLQDLEDTRRSTFFTQTSLCEENIVFYVLRIALKAFLYSFV